MSRIIRSYIVDIVETDDVIYCDNDGHLTYNIEADKNELVRCKDCKHYSVEGETTNFGWCGCWNKPTDEMRFCSDGERRE